MLSRDLSITLSRAALAAHNSRLELDRLREVALEFNVSNEQAQAFLTEARFEAVTPERNPTDETGATAIGQQVTLTTLDAVAGANRL
jgi:hypothetical protein